jgi:hypothetical protein
LAAYFGSRLLCSTFVYLGHSNRPYLKDVPGGWIGVNNWWLNPWTTYDTYWYLDIATIGYTPQSTPFFPLYPFLLRLFNGSELSMALTGVIISHLALLAALVIVYRVTAEEHGDRIAQATVWILCFSPAAPFFGAAYTESLFMLLLAGTFLAARKEAWLSCAGLAFLAALTRNPGMLIAIALYLEIRRKNPQKNSWLYLVPAAPLLAFAGVQCVFWWKFGSPLSGVMSQGDFSRGLEWPWVPIYKDFVGLFEVGHEFNYYLITATVLAVTAIALATVSRKSFPLQSGYIVLILGITLMNLVYAREITPRTISEARYMGALYPFSQALAMLFLKLDTKKFFGPLFVGAYAFIFMMFSYYYGWKVVF